MGWMNIATAPRTGQWVWGEWPAILSDDGTVMHPRIVGPMRWGKTHGTVEHWLLEGKRTYGLDPSRWAPMQEPPPEHETDDDPALGEPRTGAWLVALSPGREPVVKRSYPATYAGGDDAMADLVRMAGRASGGTMVRLDDTGELMVKDPRGSLVIACPHPAANRGRDDGTHTG